MPISWTKSMVWQNVGKRTIRNHANFKHSPGFVMIFPTFCLDFDAHQAVPWCLHCRAPRGRGPPQRRRCPPWKNWIRKQVWRPERTWYRKNGLRKHEKTSVTLINSSWCHRMKLEILMDWIELFQKSYCSVCYLLRFICLLRIPMWLLPQPTTKVHSQAENLDIFLLDVENFHQEAMVPGKPSGNVFSGILEGHIQWLEAVHGFEWHSWVKSYTKRPILQESFHRRKGVEDGLVYFNLWWLQNSPCVLFNHVV